MASVAFSLEKAHIVIFFMIGLQFTRKIELWAYCEKLSWATVTLISSIEGHRSELEIMFIPTNSFS